MSARDFFAGICARGAEMRRLRDDNGQLLGLLQQLVGSSMELRRAAFISEARRPENDGPPAWLRAADEAVIRAQATLQRYGGKP